jgi:MFS transporter, ACS family, aldohexuronate transporter
VPVETEPAYREPRAARARPSPWHVLGVAVAAQVGVSVMDQGIPTLTGFIKDDLGLSGAVAGLTVASFAIGRILGAYASGVAADRVGERRVMLLGALFAAGFVALAAATPFPFFLVLFVLGGVAGASSTPAGGRLVLLAFPRNRHGLALGIRQTGIPMGGLIAAATLPWFASLVSWRWSLVLAAAIAVLCIVPLLQLRAESPAEERPQPPAVDTPLRHDRNLVLLTLWSCLVVTGQYALLAFLALDLHQRSGLSLERGSLLVALANASGIVGRVAWGGVSDRALSRGRKPLLLVLTAGCLVSALALFATPSSASTAVMAGVAILAGLTLIGYQGLWITMVAEVAGPVRVGAATGFAVTFVGIAIALSPPFFGLVSDIAGSYRAIWGVLSVLLAIAFVPAFLVRE